MLPIGTAVMSITSGILTHLRVKDSVFLLLNVYLLRVNVILALEQVFQLQLRLLGGRQQIVLTRLMRAVTRIYLGHGITIT
ncbi:MAG: hypothetical protein GY799_15385 [Desulfobulbaceae bacterium]|nr:hypothetical protein [Desulfobulbaceae bacterium]